LLLRTTQTVTHWAKINYIKKENMPGATEIVIDWIKQGIIVEGNANAKACFALLTVPKKDYFGKQTDIRLCIDMGPGNKYIIPDNYPLPLITDVMEGPMKHREKDSVRSKIDLTEAFNRVLLVNSWVHIAFNVPGHKCKIWKVIHGFLGVNILPSHFQRIEDAIARECSFLCKVYLYDAFNEGGTKEQDILQCVELINLYTKYNLIV
jgi:hypothetical protein